MELIFISLPEHHTFSRIVCLNSGTSTRYAYGDRRAFKPHQAGEHNENTKEHINAFRGSEGDVTFPLRQVLFSFLPIEGAVLSMLVEGGDSVGMPTTAEISGGIQKNSVWGGPSALMLYCECPGTDDVSRKWNFRALNDQILYNYPRNLHKVAAPPGPRLDEGILGHKWALRNLEKL
jgi:hypothetical protein